MTLEEYIKEQRERVANMTLAQARQIVANHYGHDDMRIECEKAVWMLLNCADEKINGGWIPVTERLPKAGEYVGNVAKYYLVQNEYGDMLVARYTHSECWEQMYHFKPISDEIVAWMPLPKPYKGGE